MASPSEPVVKRKRTDSESPAIEKTTRHGEPYFDDGNIILEVQSIRFRVYRGILAASSPIFADMFSVPQPPLPAEELVDGCPVVELSDSADDWTYVLKALFERRQALYLYHIVLQENLNYKVQLHIYIH